MSSNKPLEGRRILVGRSRTQASVLSQALKSLGASVTEVPFIEIRAPRSYKPLDAALKRISEYDWLILTSVNGVEALGSRMERLRIPIKQLSHVRVATIGPATRDAAEKVGLKVELVPAQYIAESVVEALNNQVRGKRVLLARAKVARDVIPRELREQGAEVDVIDAYETVLPASSKVRLQSVLTHAAERPHLITFTSSSTVRNFVELLGGPSRLAKIDLSDIDLASIGPITSATLREYGLPVHIEAEAYTVPGLIQAIVASTES